LAIDAARHTGEAEARHLFEDAGQRVEVVLVAGARALRQRTHAFDGVVQLVALLPPQRLAEHFSQQPDIISQRLGQFVSHRDSLATIVDSERDRWRVSRVMLGKWSHQIL